MIPQTILIPLYACVWTLICVLFGWLLARRAAMPPRPQANFSLPKSMPRSMPSVPMATPTRPIEQPKDEKTRSRA